MRFHSYTSTPSVLTIDALTREHLKVRLRAMCETAAADRILRLAIAAEVAAG